MAKVISKWQLQQKDTRTRYAMKIVSNTNIRVNVIQIQLMLNRTFRSIICKFHFFSIEKLDDKLDEIYDVLILLLFFKRNLGGKMNILRTKIKNLHRKQK